MSLGISFLQKLEMLIPSIQVLSIHICNSKDWRIIFAFSIHLIFNIFLYLFVLVYKNENIVKGPRYQPMISRYKYIYKQYKTSKQSQTLSPKDVYLYTDPAYLTNECSLSFFTMRFRPDIIVLLYFWVSAGQNTQRKQMRGEGVWILESATFAPERAHKI